MDPLSDKQVKVRLSISVHHVSSGIIIHDGPVVMKQKTPGQPGVFNSCTENLICRSVARKAE